MSEIILRDGTVLTIGPLSGAPYLWGVGPVGSWIPLVRTELGYEGLDLRHTEYAACKRAMEAAGVRVRP